MILAGMRLALVVSAAALFVACHSPGQYGYSRTYSPLDAESHALTGAVEYDPVMAKRQPDAWKGKPLSVFGVVLSRTEGTGGSARLKLSLRTLESRNLCESSSEDTCRVTVSEREHSIAHALVELGGDDDVGPLSVGASSLVRVVGQLVDDVDPNDGSPVLRATYYRHWPRNYYVTTAARSHMRR